jgi:NADH:ubiquinone oxidoreductase subunit 3 (subunit A)
MELNHFLVFLALCLGFPLLIALYINSKKIQTKRLESLESGLQSHIRKTNRHKNNYFSLSIIFGLFAMAGFILIMLTAKVEFGKENWPYYVMSLWTVFIILVSYAVARLCGGISLDE